MERKIKKISSRQVQTMMEELEFSRSITGQAMVLISMMKGCPLKIISIDTEDCPNKETCNVAIKYRCVSQFFISNRNNFEMLRDAHVKQ